MTIDERYKNEKLIKNFFKAYSKPEAYIMQRLQENMNYGSFCLQVKQIYTKFLFNHRILTSIKVAIKAQPLVKCYGLTAL